ncbi:MAG: hypothetical protein KGS61_12780 [Verrucomicrobia bacterium]|nr:hypothetical protein [Verrucomicrobiota bacterium]
MTDDLVPFGSPLYCGFLLLLVFARGMDFASTWLATPNLVLEANPLARKLGWRGGLLLNAVLCAAFALWPMPAVIIATTSVLVAARNFQSAWLMRSLGEERYRYWFAEQIGQTRLGLYVMCLAAQAVLIAGVGGALMYFSPHDLVPFAIGMGIITYAAAVAVYTLLSLWRIRR